MKLRSFPWRWIALVAGFFSGYIGLQRRAKQRRLQLLHDQPQPPGMISTAREVLRDGGLHSRFCALSLSDDGLRVSRGFFKLRLEFIPHDSIRRVELTQTIDSVSLPVNMLHLICSGENEYWFLLDDDHRPWIDRLLSMIRERIDNHTLDL